MAVGFLRECGQREGGSRAWWVPAAGSVCVSVQQAL